ncbi:MAG TPA: SLC13 family permease [Verrucomicrobiota bacterium]|nr:SLC13 family permease [Verrucomicrobiota bacterium]
MHLLAIADTSSLWPFAVLGICVATIVVLITVLRIHAFLALIMVAILAGLLAAPGSLPGEPAKSHWVQAVEITTAEFGTTAGKIGVVIGLAAIISLCLMESGAADKVVRRFLAVFGEKRAGIALLTSSYVLSIPIFFDTFFMLMLPLARALALRTGRDYVLYLMAICSASVVTHCLLAPHPGPLAMAEALHVDLGITIFIGLICGVLPVAAGWQFSKWINRRVTVSPPETPGVSAADIRVIEEKPESELPSFFWSIAPVILPIALIGIASFFDAGVKNPASFQWLIGLFGGDDGFKTAARVAEFIGNRNMALLFGAVIAMGVLIRQKKIAFAKLGTMIGPSLETAGVIILITSAGGAFGLMLKHAGVGDAVKSVAGGASINLVFLAWLVSSVIRIAQGSATVAMLTTSAMIYPVMTSGPELPYHPVYIFMAIGYGSMICSWMNDSGFWVVGKLSGFTEKQTLKTWTSAVTVISVAGLIECLALSALLPLKAG